MELVTCIWFSLYVCITLLILLNLFKLDNEIGDIEGFIQLFILYVAVMIVIIVVEFDVGKR